MTAKPAILCVDDEPRLLEGMQRNLRRSFRVTTALSPEEGLARLAGERFEVVVSEMQMPVMNGAQFLAEVKVRAPQSTRVLLTGQSSMDDAIAAVNRGAIFRFLTKPCPPPQLIEALGQAVEQHRLVTAEKELLDKTLTGSVRVLVEALGLVNPMAFGRAQRLQRYVSHVVRTLEISAGWRYEVAAMLSQLGCMTLPEEIVEKVYVGQSLDAEEERAWRHHPEQAANLIRRIPRLGPVATMVEFQGGEVPAEVPDEVRHGAQLLKTCLTFDDFVRKGYGARAATNALKRTGGHRSDVLTALAALDDLERNSRIGRVVGVEELAPGMILEEDVRNVNGTLIAGKGSAVTLSMTKRLVMMGRRGAVAEPFRVSIAA